MSTAKSDWSSNVNVVAPAEEATAYTEQNKRTFAKLSNHSPCGKMLAVSTDGGTVMQWHANGVHAELERMVQEESAEGNSPCNSLMLSICMAHKRNLVVAAKSRKIFKLAEALVMVMHHILGSMLRTTVRKVYNKVAKKKCLPTLQVEALFKVGWWASLTNSI
ncbi:hypothetical protein Aduo_019197 [Ancylostoma duodenale]